MENELLQKVINHPNSIANWSILGDWYEAHGDPARGQVIAESLRLPSLTPEEARAARKRISLLTQQNIARWQQELPTFAGIRWGAADRGLVYEVFLDDIELLPIAAEKLRAVAPIRRVVVNHFEGLSKINILENRAFPWLRELCIFEGYGLAEDTERFFALPLLLDLELLNLDGGSMGNEGTEIIAKVPFRRLRKLLLDGNYIGSRGLAALADSAHLYGLKELSLSGYGYGSYSDDPVVKTAGIDALLASPMAFSLETLNLTGNQITAEDAAKIFESLHLGALKTLLLGNNDLGGIRPKPGGAARLTYLNVSGCGLKAEDVKQVVSLPVCSELEVLDVSESTVGTDLAVLEPVISHLESLAIREMNLSSPSVQWMKKQPRMPRVLDMNKVETKASWKNLFGAPWWAELEQIDLGGANFGTSLSHLLQHTFPRLERLSLAFTRGYHDAKKLTAHPVPTLPKAPLLSVLQLGTHALGEKVDFGSLPSLNELYVSELSDDALSTLKPHIQRGMVQLTTALTRAQFEKMGSLKGLHGLHVTTSHDINLLDFLVSSGTSATIECLNLTFKDKVTEETLSALTDTSRWPCLRYVGISAPFENYKLQNKLYKLFSAAYLWQTLTAPVGFGVQSNDIPYQGEDIPF